MILAKYNVLNFDTTLLHRKLLMKELQPILEKEISDRERLEKELKNYGV